MSKSWLHHHKQRLSFKKKEASNRVWYEHKVHYEGTENIDWREPHTQLSNNGKTIKNLLMI